MPSVHLKSCASTNQHVGVGSTRVQLVPEEDVMKWTANGLLAVVGAALMAANAMPARADVVNGGFETGDFAGWVQTGDVSFSGVDLFAARSGTYGAFFGPTDVGGISQSFATIANTPYQVSFSLSLLDSATPNSFTWNWNGVTQSPSLSNSSTFGYTQFSSIVQATGPSSTIAFNFRDPQAFFFLDNVAVAAVVPELPVNTLLSVGLLLTAVFARRTAKRPVA